MRCFLYCVFLESRMRASVAVSSFDQSTPFKRPHSTISNSSSSSSSSQSSSSLLGSLNLHLYPSHPSLSHWPYDCIEEDELEHDSTAHTSMSESDCTSTLKKTLVYTSAQIWSRPRRCVCERVTVCSRTFMWTAVIETGSVKQEVGLSHSAAVCLV